MKIRQSTHRTITLLLSLACLLSLAPNLQAQRSRRDRYEGCTYGPAPAPTKLPWEDAGDFYNLVSSSFNFTGIERPYGTIVRYPGGATLLFKLESYRGPFHGHFQPAMTDSLTQPFARNWNGIDTFATIVARDIVMQVTTYDPQRFPIMDSVTCLGGPLTISVSMVCKFDRNEMTFGSGSAPYLGEFSFLHPGSDTLRFPIIIEGKDTTAAIGIGQPLNNFEQAAINALAIQLQLKVAMSNYCGTAPDYLMQLHPLRRGIFPLIWPTISMRINHNYQKPLVITNVALQFGSKFKVSEQIAPPTRSVKIRR
ncbi:MAG: hypothetical protein U0176_17720 [Bacteroidia bacterium]